MVREMATVQEVEELSAMSEQDLLVSIGTDLAGKPAMPISRQELLERGQAWFRHNAQELRVVICPKAKELVKETDMQKAIIAVADLMAGILIHVAPFKVAALIVRAGVEKFCSDGQAK